MKVLSDIKVSDFQTQYRKHKVANGPEQGSGTLGILSSQINFHVKVFQALYKNVLGVLLNKKQKIVSVCYY